MTIKTFKTLLIAVVTVLLVTACSVSNNKTRAVTGTIELTGIIQQTGMTTYQYGTHILTTDKTFYALKSSNINLNKFIGEKITITGKKVSGYPIDNGPELIDVLEVRE